MQRPKEEELKAKIRAEQQRRMKESHWVLREESTRFVDTFFFHFISLHAHLFFSLISLEESILFDGFTPGRRSFRGFNPLVESLATEREAEDIVAQARRTADAAAAGKTGSVAPEDAEADTPIAAFSNGPRPQRRRNPAQAARARQMEAVLMPATVKPTASAHGRAGKMQPARRHQ